MLPAVWCHGSRLSSAPVTCRAEAISRSTPPNLPVVPQPCGMVLHHPFLTTSSLCLPASRSPIRTITVLEVVLMWLAGEGFTDGSKMQGARLQNRPR